MASVVEVAITLVKVGAAGAVIIVIGTDSTEVPIILLLFFAIAVIVYVTLFENPLRSTYALLDDFENIGLPLILAYMIYVAPPLGVVYETVIDIPLILEITKSVGAAGADNAVVAMDSSEIPELVLLFVAIAVIVYIVFDTSPVKVTTLESSVDIAETVV